MNARSPSRSRFFQHHGLVSLLAMIFEYSVYYLTKGLNEIERFEDELLGHMQGGEDYSEEKLLIGNNAQSLLTKAGLSWANSFLEMIRDDLKPLELITSQLEIKHIQKHAHEWSAIRVAEAFRTLRWKIEQELYGKCFLHIDPQETILFKNDFPFGSEVARAFPSLDLEIRSAAKCLALEMGTASAFHSIRSLESALRALARCLGVPDPTNPRGRNWGEALKLIKAEMDRRWNASARMSGDGKFFEETYAVLAAMRNPYRNSTMHLEQNYNPKDARYVFDTVKVFLQKVASRMDENGLPLA
jgi:hypothetical protein